MRILEVVDTLTMGGAQRVIERLAEAASNSPDVELSVVALSHPEDSLIRDSLQRHGVDAHILAPRTRGDLSDPLIPLQLARVVRRHDLVHTHLGTSNVLGAVAGRLARRPSVLTLHTVQPGGAESKVGSGLRDRAIDWALRTGATHVVAVGRAVRDAHAMRVADRTVPIVANPAPPIAPIEPAERDRARRRHGVTGPVLVAVGRLEAPKGLDDLLRAVAVRPADHMLLVAGAGSLEADLRALATDLGIDQRVRFLGNVDDVGGVLAAADVFVTSSIREGMPMAVLEAMARGLPVVATDVGDVAATVGDAGRVVPPGRPDLLAEAVGAVLETDAARRHRAEALRLARDVHGIDVWFDRWCALWRAVIDGRPPPDQLAAEDTAR